MHADRIDLCPIPVMQIAEQGVMAVLLGDDQCSWSRAELEREVAGIKGKLGDVSDAITSLHGAGLINVSGDIVAVSRAARRMDELEL